MATSSKPPSEQPAPRPPVPGLRRILLKLSGEALMGEEDYGVDPKMLKRVALEIREVMSLGMQVAVVIGGGNIFRGAGLARAGMDRVTGDHMGMLATVMNSLAMQDAVEALGLYARVMSAIRINEVCEEYIRRRAVRHLEKGRVVHSRGRHRQSVLHDRHRREPARDRDQRRPAAEGHQGQRHLLRRPDEESAGDALCAPDLRQGADGSPQRDGCDRDRHVPRQQPAAARVRPDEAGRAAAHRARRGRRDAGDANSASWENAHAGRHQERRERAHEQVRRGAEERAEEAAHRPRAHQPAGAHPRRVLRQHGAAQPGRQHRARGCAHADRDALGEDHGAGDREGDHEVRPRSDAEHRRHA